MPRRSKLVRFVLLHVTSLAVFFVPFSGAAFAAFAASFAFRLFGITLAYHRYFAHRSFEVGRGGQLALALWGATAGQRGPLWWAAQHRRHHAHSDGPLDHHSPKRLGFWQAHMGWVFDARTTATDDSLVADFARFPELQWINRNHFVPLLGFAAVVAGSGSVVGAVFPSSGASAAQFLAWGFCASTLALAHATLAVNSFGHTYGRRAFGTGDESRNLWWLGLLTGGEGWHNNHHRFPRSARHGLLPGQLDATYVLIRALEAVGLVSRVRLPSRAEIDDALQETGAERANAPGGVSAARPAS
jgi:stearoyl-CoA desaturase (delta-9 desaturase)